MLEKAMKYAFAIVGAITGLTVTRFVYVRSEISLNSFTGIVIMVVASLAFGTLMLFVGGKIVGFVAGSMEKPRNCSNADSNRANELCCRLIAGLIVATSFCALMKIQIKNTLRYCDVLRSCGVFLAYPTR